MQSDEACNPSAAGVSEDTYSELGYNKPMQKATSDRSLREQLELAAKARKEAGKRSIKDVQAGKTNSPKTVEIVSQTDVAVTELDMPPAPTQRRAEAVVADVKRVDPEPPAELAMPPAPGKKKRKTRSDKGTRRTLTDAMPPAPSPEPDDDSDLELDHQDVNLEPVAKQPQPAAAGWHRIGDQERFVSVQPGAPVVFDEPRRAPAGPTRVFIEQPDVPPPGSVSTAPIVEALKAAERAKHVPVISAEPPKQRRRRSSAISDLDAIRKIDRILSQLAGADKKRVMDFVGAKYFATGDYA